MCDYVLKVLPAFRGLIGIHGAYGNVKRGSIVCVTGENTVDGEWLHNIRCHAGEAGAKHVFITYCVPIFFN